MAIRLLLILTAGVLMAAPVSVREAGFQADEGQLPPGWSVWAPRPEIAPRAFVDRVHYRRQPGSLALSGNSNQAVFGGWERSVKDVEAGKWYRFAAHYCAEGVKDERLQVVARIDWRRADGKRAGQPEYAYKMTAEGPWRRVTLEAPAPERAVSATIQLFLQNAPQATVWWDEISLEQIAAPGPREVTVATMARP